MKVYDMNDEKSTLEFTVKVNQDRANNTDSRVEVYTMYVVRCLHSRLKDNLTLGRRRGSRQNKQTKRVGEGFPVNIDTRINV